MIVFMPCSQLSHIHCPAVACGASNERGTRSSLHRCLQRHGISRLPDMEGDKPKRQKFKRYPIGYFHIDIAELRTNEGKLYLFVAIHCPAVNRKAMSREGPNQQVCRGTACRKSKSQDGLGVPGGCAESGAIQDPHNSDGQGHSIL